MNVWNFRDLGNEHFPRHCSILYWTWGTEILQFLNDPFEGS